MKLGTIRIEILCIDCKQCKLIVQSTKSNNETNNTEKHFTAATL